MRHDQGVVKGRGRRRVSPMHTMRRPTMPDGAAIVTGASRGIGLALAEVLGEEGYGLTISSRKADSLEKTADALRARGFDVEHAASDGSTLAIDSSLAHSARRL